jgi:hypothetical protein
MFSKKKFDLVRSLHLALRTPTSAKTSLNQALMEYLHPQNLSLSHHSPRIWMRNVARRRACCRDDCLCMPPLRVQSLAIAAHDQVADVMEPLLGVMSQRSLRRLRWRSAKNSPEKSQFNPHPPQFLADLESVFFPIHGRTPLSASPQASWSVGGRQLRGGRFFCCPQCPDWKIRGLSPSEEIKLPGAWCSQEPFQARRRWGRLPAEELCPALNLYFPPLGGRRS